MLIHLAYTVPTRKAIAMKHEHKDFTADRVERFRCQPGKHQSIYWDGRTPGLGLRVTANDNKAYVFESRLNSHTIRITIGNPDTWPLETQWHDDKETGKRVEHQRGARQEAQRLKALTDQGIDPRQQREEQRNRNHIARTAAKQKSVLVGDAWAEYLSHHSKRWGARHIADHRNLSQNGGSTKKRGTGTTVQGVLYPLLQMKLGEITAEVLIEWQNKEAANRANNARQGFEMFRAFWRWCAMRPAYASAVNVQAVENKDLRQEVPSRKTKRFDVLERAKLAAWFSAVRQLNNPVVSVYLQALLLTGARREEMASLTWKDVDFDWHSLWVKDKVAKEGRKIPLTPYLSSLLKTLPRKNKWVFSSEAAIGGRIAEPRIPHNRALAVAGLDHVTLHGLRRTFASLAEWVEIPSGVVAQIMGHAPNATAEKHYINRPLELLAAWHDKYEAWILKQAGVRFAVRKGKTKGKTKQTRALRLVSAA
jgi:integrase